MAKKAEKKIEGEVLSISFATGEALSIGLADVPSDTLTRLAMHGLSQKVGDAYAGGEPEEAYARAAAVVADLLAGNWTTRVAASGPKATQLAEALALATGKTMDEAAAVLETMDEDQKKDLRKHPQIKVQLATIKARLAEAAAAKAIAEAVDAPALSF